MVEHVLPFGRHKGQAVGEVPSGYLEWLLREVKLSSGLRAAVAAELQARGVAVPDVPAPPPFTVRACWVCGDVGFACGWLEDSLGRRRVRAECVRCGRCLGHPPSVPPFSTMADAAASPTAVPDVLTRLEALGIELVSDGRSVNYKGTDYHRVPLDLRALVRQCSHQLARMMGNRTVAK
jgi:hypothetical protein